jgi:hypothetical protein
VSAPNNGDGFTVKEIVVDIRDTVKALANKVDQIDRQGSIGTRDQLAEHNRDIANHEARLGVLEQRPHVSREDLHAVKGDIAALKMWQAGLTAVAGLKRWQITVALTLIAAGAGLIGSLITLFLYTQ